MDMSMVLAATSTKIQLKILIPIFLLVLSSCLEKGEEKILEPTSDSFFNHAIYNNEDSKLWRHRVNTTSLAAIALDEFNGIELDVVFESDTSLFNVRHDLDAPASNIYLDEYLNSVSKYDSAYFWIDFKNLTDVNAREAGERLRVLLDKYALWQRVIVESYNQNAIKYFNELNIYTSYWVPHLDGNSSRQDSLNALIVLDKFTKSKRFNALSAHHPMYSFLNEHYPNQNIHLWTNGLSGETGKDIIRDLSSKDNIKVILVDYDTDFTK